MLTVGKTSGALTLSSSANPSAPNQPVTLTFNVAGYNPYGTVTFMDGTTTLGTATVLAGAANFNYTFGTLGAHSVTANYSGDYNNNAGTSNAVSQTVGQATTATTLTSSLNPSALSQTITLTASVAGSAPTGAVTFMDGTTTLGTANVTNGSATLNYSFTSMGAHSLTANYAGDASNAASASTALAQTVGRANSATALSSSAPASAPNQAVTLTASVTGYTPTGTVTFMDGTTTLGTANLTNGAATLSYTFTAGAHPLTASYSGDANNNASVSIIMDQGVAGQGAVYYIHPDQLDTPRAITDTAGNVLWQWDNTDAFGNNAPNENPSNLGQFSFNLRFPGQYFDKETSLAYNINRDYDAATGRYIQSDPIGLGGGINTFTYVGGNPLRWSDIFGLYATCTIVGGTVNIVIPILFSDTEGREANPELIQKWIKSIQDNWSAPGFNVTVTRGPENQVTVQPYPMRSHVDYGDRGDWWAGANPWMAAHEAGHLMGLGDMYVDLPGRGSVALPGHEGTIMGDIGGRVTDDDRKMIKSKLCPCDKK